MFYLLVVVMLFPSGQTLSVEFRDQFPTHSACMQKGQTFAQVYIDPTFGAYERALVFCHPPA